MKRFLLFSYHSHAPSGGWEDSMGLFDTLDEAMASVSTGDQYQCETGSKWHTEWSCDTAYIMDLETEREAACLDIRRCDELITKEQGTDGVLGMQRVQWIVRQK